MKTPAGRAGFSVLLFQDIAVIPILAVLPFLALPELLPQAAGAEAHDLHPARPGWLQALLVLAVVVGIVVAGRFLLRPVFHWIASTRSLELFIATALALVVGITLATEFAGLSPALGTFLAGVVLAESEFRHELESNIEPFKGLLLGLFFISVGASIDFGLVVAQPLVIDPGCWSALIAVKFAVLLVLGLLFRLAIAGHPDVRLSAGTRRRVRVPAVFLRHPEPGHRRDVGNLLVVVVVLSMVLTPLLMILYERLVRPMFRDSVATRADDAIDSEPTPVIIAGYGRFGQIVSRLLRADGIEATLLDHDSGQIELTGRFGNKVFFGDASRVQLLQAAGAEEAKLLVIAIDEREKAVQMVQAAKQFFPHLKTLARAYDRSHAYRLMEAGADVVTRETFGSALIMGEEALLLLGYDPARAYRLMRSFKRHDEEGLRKLYEVWGDDHAYGLRMRQNIEELERVLKDDSEEAEDHYRDAWQSMRDAEISTLFERLTGSIPRQALAQSLQLLADDAVNRRCDAGQPSLRMPEHVVGEGDQGAALGHHVQVGGAPGQPLRQARGGSDRR